MASTKRACIFCQKSKTRCDRENPCGICSKRKVSCIYVQEDAQSRAKNRRDFFHRLKMKHARLESLFEKVVGLQPNSDMSIDAISPSHHNDTVTTNTNSPSPASNDSQSGYKYCNVTSKSFEKVVGPHSGSSKASNSTESTRNYNNVSVRNLETLNTTQSIHDFNNMESESPEALTTAQSMCSLDNIKELVETFFKFQNRAEYLIAPEKEPVLLKSQTVQSMILKYSLCAAVLNLYNCLNKLPYISLKNNSYYRICKSMIKEGKYEPSLEIVQALSVCMFLEMGNGEVYQSSLTNMEGVRIGQILSLHLSENMCQNELFITNQLESYITWVRCVAQDRMVSLYYSRPSSVSTSIFLGLPDLNFSLKNNTGMPDDLFSRLIHHKITSITGYLMEEHFRLITIKEQSKLPDANINELKAKVDASLNKLNGLARCEMFSFTPESVMACSVNTIEHPFLLSCLSANTFRLSLLCLVYGLKTTFSTSEDDDQLIQHLDFATDYKKLGLRLYKFITAIENKLKKDTKTESFHLFYHIHFGNVFNLEWATYPFTLDKGEEGMKFVKLCKAKIFELSKLWPIFQGFNRDTSLGFLGDKKFCGSHP
ncbi:hypothetical protein K502DRAFT_344423 [Neoconidiobolus thromboides FSU 785]|nr:hypothetical protein K502DRAFT_344423 [Neoconidiobolus thromboides FSU 785]